MPSQYLHKDAHGAVTRRLKYSTHGNTIRRSKITVMSTSLWYVSLLSGHSAVPHVHWSRTSDESLLQQTAAGPTGNHTSYMNIHHSWPANHSSRRHGHWLPPKTGTSSDVFLTTSNQVLWDVLLDFPTINHRSVALPSGNEWSWVSLLVAAATFSCSMGLSLYLSLKPKSETLV